MTATTSTRRLNPGEWQLYRTIRLEALRESPEAFSSRYEVAIDRSDQSWADQADSTATGSNRATFVMFDDQPVGLAALYRDENAPDVGELVQMWIAPGVRGGSAATDMLVEIFRWARTNRFAVVKAEVMKSNARALKFYEVRILPFNRRSHGIQRRSNKDCRLAPAAAQQGK